MKSSKKYLLLISIHGLIRAHDLELGRDADTGGQTKYVVDLARALASCEGVAQVDLVTRRLVDHAVDAEYAEGIERLSDKARLIRIDAGPEGYLAKEMLWDVLDNFSDSLLNWLNDQPRMPDVIHSHYADAGYVGVKLSNLLEIPLVHTGHSLGRDKRRHLLARGLSRSDIEERYKISRRIDAEEEVLANADLVITSTRNEIEQQYERYDYYRPDCMAVIPPGVNLKQFYPPDKKDRRPDFARQLSPFLKDPDKAIILALCRPDERKNLAFLMECYGQSRLLQECANLVIVAGCREDIRELDDGAQAVLTELLLLIDCYDLYGRVALPKSHRPEEVPEIFRLAARSNGVLINIALTEPFGLTLLEAAASGLPVVATENGGPVDIIDNCKNGLLVDPLDQSAVTCALLQILQAPESWRAYAQSGVQAVKRHYSWTNHAETYLEKIDTMLKKHERIPTPSPGRRAMRYHDRAIFTPLDLTLLEQPEGLERLMNTLREHRRSVSFGIATGRRLDTAMTVMKKNGIPYPDVLISSLGTEIHYFPSLTADSFWADHIEHLWNPRAIRRLLDDLPGLKPQEKHEQSRYKISYYYDQKNAPSIEEINALLRSEEQTVNVVHSFGQYLDVIPVRASKGQALRYFAQRWEIALDKILVVGGSGADEDMMLGNTLAAILSNRHHEELSQLIDLERVYFAQQSHALGILEAIAHYDFFADCRAPLEET